MLQRLSIENYTVLPRVEVRFSPGLNVITGETGVGKSLLLDAVGYLLGERRTGFPIRAGCSRAVIEAEFEADQKQILQQWLLSCDFVADFPVLLRREFLDSGRTRIFINDTPATLSQARTLGDLLIDLHGQHEVVALFDRARQLNFLDEFTQQPQPLKQYMNLFGQIKARREDLAALELKIQDSSAGWESLQKQQQELEALHPLPAEIFTLEAELKRLENAEHIVQLCEEICGRLNEASGSAVENILAILRKLPDLYSYEASLSFWDKELENAHANLLELNRTLQELSRSTKHDPNYVEEQRQRLMALLGFRKRWNCGTEDLCVVSENVARRLQELSAMKEEVRSQEQQIAEFEQAAIKAGQELSAARQKAARRLEIQVQKRLADIGMPKAHFRVRFAPQQTAQPYPDGLDRLEFELSPDGKLPHQPLRQVASGGEMSRILLALKGALASADHVETLIFDEVDQGISGRVARMVGLQLSELAQKHQVILVTHLPQIASLGDTHLSVRSTGNDGAATVHVLDEEERVRELASLLTAAGISAGALLNAREMLDSAREMRQRKE